MTNSLEHLNEARVCLNEAKRLLAEARLTLVAAGVLAIAALLAFVLMRFFLVQ